MTPLPSCIYEGHVVHKRLAPIRHAFRYSVFSLCLDIDEIDRLDRSSRFFSRNRFNLVSFHDADFGARDGTAIANFMRPMLAAHGLAVFSFRILLLCYPRILGYVFNPLSVYFCYDSKLRLGVIVYEVTNTFGERTSILLPVDEAPDDTIVAQRCAKQMYVSPFIAAAAEYGFAIVPPGDKVVVGVNVRDETGPVLKTHFRGDHIPLNDAALLRALATHPLMTLKIIGGIHLEAARLWRKGVPLVERHASQRHAVVLASNSPQKAAHAH